MPVTFLEQTSITINWFALAINMTLLGLVVVSRNLKEKVFRWFFVVLFLNLLQSVCELTKYFLVGPTGMKYYVLLRSMELSSYIIPLLQLVAYALYLYEYLEIRTQISKRIVYVVTSICAIALMLAIYAHFTHIYGYYDEMLRYHAQDTYWVSEIPYLLCIAVFVSTLRYHAKSLKRRELSALLLYFGLPILCYTVEALVPNLWLTNLGATIAIFIIYVNIQMEYKRQWDAELLENRISIMLSQIQPHFLYNALNTIDGLYYENSDAGHEAMLAFSEYLRVNMDSLTQKKLIPFERELEHTKQYLLLEQLRFEERLQIVFDIQTDQFMLPVLTLQPIVENAVKHGIPKQKTGGIVTIRTEETKECYRITVADNGLGFDMTESKRDDRSHNGIANVKNRLEAMCGGTLSIESAIGKGTTAIIEIPKAKDAMGYVGKGE